MMDKLRLVKTTVFILTFALVFGSLVLLGSLYKKTQKGNASFPQEINLQEPQGSFIKNMLEQNGRLYIQVEGGGEADRIIIFDITSGQKLSTLKIN